MRPELGSRRRRLTLTPLIDVIFLLLLFFMLSSTFARFGEVELTMASPGRSAVAETPPMFLRLSENGLSLNGREVATDAIGEAVARLRNDGQVRLLLSVFEGARAQELADAVLALRAVPDSTLALLR